MRIIARKKKQEPYKRMKINLKIGVIRSLRGHGLSLSLKEGQGWITGGLSCQW